MADPAPASIQKRTIHTFALVALVPVLLTIVAYRSQSEFREDVEWVRLTHEALNRIETVLNLVNEAETGQRGFLITGDDAYLRPYEAAKEQIHGEVDQLRHQLADDLTALRLSADLAGEINQKFSEMGVTIQTRRTKGRDAAFEVVQSNRGQELMGRIRETVDAIRNHETQLLEQRRSQEETTATLFSAAFVLGSLVTLALLIWALRMIRRYEAETQRAAFEVLSLNQELERRVEIRTQELVRSNEDLQRFAYVASHDLQEPLRMVAGYVGLLARRYQEKLDADADQFIRFAVDGAKRMQDLINDLLTCARAGTEALTIRRTALQSVADQAIHNLNSAIAESGAEITCDELPELEVDETKLAQVFQNLLSNSIKFRRPGVPLKVHMGARPHGDAWVFTVTDNGIGFDPKHAERIFLMFQRLHGVGKYPGTGIGLAIVRRIVEAHGGQISAEGTPDGGATFTFTLPANMAAKPQAALKATR